MSTELMLNEDSAQMEAIVTEYLKGYSNREIAKKLGLSNGLVGKYLKQWREVASKNSAVKERAGIALQSADEHYNSLMVAAHAALDDAELNGSVNQRIAAINTIANLEKTRIDMLQKAGVLEDADVTKKIAETERKQSVLTDILRTVVGPCDRCRPLVQRKLAEATTEVVVIHAE